MGYRFTKYMKLSANALHTALKDRNLPPDRVREIKQIVDEQKALKRKASAHKRQMDLVWGELLEPLMHERKTVKSIMRYKGSPERAEALEGYFEVLDKLVERLYMMRRDKDKTPAQLYPDRTHWSDYVPQHIKDEVHSLFDAIPYKAKAKVKTPFARTIPVILHNKQRARLERRTLKELAIAERNHAHIEASEKSEQTIERIKKALQIIRSMQPNEPVPATWHGFFEGLD
jgi:hypothetical protein